MTDHDNNAAAVLPERRTPNAERCPVVDLVTLSTNLKTEDLKTVTPKKHTNFAALPQFWRGPERRTRIAWHERARASGRVEWADQRPVVDPAPCSLYPAPCPVVDLVTTFRNLKTEDLKTVTPKNIQIPRRSPTSAATPNAAPEQPALSESAPTGDPNGPNAALSSTLHPVPCALNPVLLSILQRATGI
jgi:hypothetical protein